MNNNIEDIYELSPMQQGMLFHKLAAPSSVVYFEQNCFTLQTQLDISAFQKAWQRVVDRHPILRTSFYWENLDKPYQVVHQQVDLPWEFQDWQNLSLQEQQKQLKAFLKADSDRGFDLSQAPLIRLTLIQVADDTYKFVFSFHHILMEGWSISWLWNEFYQFYQAFCQGKDLYLERPRLYREYITWLQQQDLQKAEAYWRQKLKGFTVPTPIAVSKTSASFSSQKEAYDRQQIQISASLTTALKSFARKHQLTLNILLKGAWALLLSRYSGESDIVFGATSSGRPAALLEAESMVGLFINTLPLRVEVPANAFLLPWLKNLQAQEVEMRQYEYSPLLQIQQWSEIPRGLSLFDSLLVFNNYLVDSNQGNLAQSMGISESRSFEKTNYPLTLVVEPDADSLHLLIPYDTRHFERATVSRILNHLETLLEGIVGNPQQRLSELPLLTPAEKTQFAQWNNTQTEYPQETSIHKLFEAQVEKTPDAVAVVFENHQLTYRELNTKANQLAHYLRSLGVKSEVLVGICIERSLLMVIGLLAILKAGGAYIPLDPSYPQQRLAYMLEDSQPTVLLTQQQLVENLPAHKAKLICLDTNWEVIAQHRQQNPDYHLSSDRLAYVIYTSGSTGKPKGAMNTHRGICNRLLWMQEQYQLTATDRVLQKTPFSFDVSVWEFFWPLITGARLVVAKAQGHRDPNYLVNVITQQQITTIHFVPSMLQVFLEAENLETCESLLRVIVSGEALPVELQQRFCDRLNAQLHNLYGPTEAAVDVTFWQCQNSLTTQKTVPIGYPIANIQIYLLDENLNPVPIGVPGELYIGGVGVGRGYLNRPELTAEKFIPNPFKRGRGAGEQGSRGGQEDQSSNSERLYKTGDLARYLPNGEIEYIGRIDYQVKIRGFRIELGEIEAFISQYPTVRETVVVATDTQSLVAYIVPHIGQTLSISELRNFLESKLPSYMVPTAFVLLEALPLTPNGKCDRKALPAPDTTRPELEAVYQPPQTEVEKTIAEIWQEVIQVENLGIHDNFFELGGHSLLLVQVHSKLQKTFQRDFSMIEMFQYPTISHLARYLIQESSEQPSFTQHSHRPESRTASVQQRKQARKEHRAATKHKSH